MLAVITKQFLGVESLRN